ncbi:MAG: hypothetical protein K2N30_01050 [Clostridia bacterium]|nr:hypothetical protein [Clostridia bacterium]
MSWFNWYGLIAVVVILIPNIIISIVDKQAFENKFEGKAVIISEQIGRYGCMAFMVFNVPYTYFGFWFDNALTVYLAVGGALLFIYILGWIIFRKGRSLFKMLWLSVTPSVLFLFCGAIVSSVPLIVFAVIFSVGHITVSVKNADKK